MNKIMCGLLGIMTLIVVVLAFLLFAIPAHAPTTSETQTNQQANDQQPTTTAIDPNAPLHDRVKVTLPQKGATVSSPIAVTGEAPGNWFFEASFPIKVKDKDGNTIATTHGEALSDWMTTAQVPFSAKVILDVAYTGEATLVLMKDNPSGLPEHDDAIEIPLAIK